MKLINNVTFWLYLKHGKPDHETWTWNRPWTFYIEFLITWKLKNGIFQKHEKNFKTKKVLPPKFILVFLKSFKSLEHAVF
jgi:hypothetical protein